MDFKKTVMAELEDKYAKMLNSSTPMPYKKTPKVDEQQAYIDNRGRYYRRLEVEKSEFNNACQTVQYRRNLRKNQEYSNKEAKENNRFRRGQAFRTCIFFLPVVIAILVGFDVFNKSHGHIDTIKTLELEEGVLSLGFVIFLYVVFCLIALISAICFTVKMFSNESYKSYVKDKKRGYKKVAIVVALISVIIVALNMVQVVSNLGNNKIVFEGGDKVVTQYVEKGESIILPDCNKSDTIYETYKTKYTFEGWVIDGVLYHAGDEYKPSGRITINAQFFERDWCTISVSLSNASLTISYNGKTLEGQDEYEIPRGTRVTLTAEFDYDDTSFSVGDYKVESPCTFILDENVSVKASSSNSSSCLVEGANITLADGTTKKVEDLQMGDVLVVFNHETGLYETAPLLVNVHANGEADYRDVINLYFSDGTLLKIVEEHGLFDKDLNKYVYINEENVNDFIGHNFVSARYQDGEIISELVTLVRFEFTNELVKIFNPASVWHINLIADNMLTLSAGMVNLFEYDEKMKYDEVLMAEDIEKYGLYTYDDFKNYVSIEVFNAFPFKYYKVAIEKGLFTYEEVLGLIQFYDDIDSLK